jgi:hypothetical protein
MPTFIDGVGQCEVIDRSAELVDLKGHDITSLPKTGTFTWEHQANSPATLVGKILKAKKIFSKDDCDDERQLYYWDKCKAPYLYVMGELLDDYTASAKECAGQMRYSRDNPGQSPLLGFSIEGSELPGTRKGSVITRSIARKVTLTQAPCNAMCVAEIFDGDQKPQIKDDFEEIFKSEANAIELFKSGEGVKIYETYLAKKEAEGPSQGGKPPKSPGSEYQGQGIQSGRTKAGEPAFSHGHIAPYKFNPAEHQEGGEFHEHASVIAQNPKLQENKEGRAAMNATATASGGRRENRAALSLNDKNNIANQQGKQLMAKGEKVCELHKATTGIHGGKSTISGHEKGVHLPLAVDPGTSVMGTHVRRPTPGYSKEAAKIHANVTHREMKEIKPKLEKAEPKGWSPAKVDKKNGAVHWNHPNHGHVSVVKQNNGQFHVKHHGGLAGLKGVKGIFPTSKEAGKHAKNYMSAVSNGTVAPVVGHKELKKAIEAGSYNAAPSTLTNGAAYQTESLGSRQATTGAEDHDFQATKKKDWNKKDWNKKANEEYDRWPDKEKFEKFMAARMPHLAAGEIRAIGKLMSLKKSLELEKAEEKNPKLGSHFLFSAENPVHKDKVTSKMNHKQTLQHLKSKGFKTTEVQGHYGSPENSIMVHNVSPKQAEHLHGLASKLGQDSSLYSHNGTHENRYHHGQNAGKSAWGSGTVWHKEKPKDFYTTLPSGKHFTHNLDLDNLIDTKPIKKSEDAKKELDSKSLKDIQIETAKTWAKRAEEAYKRAIDEKSIKWLLDGDEYFHESIEHSSLSEDLTVFEEIRAKLMPIRKQAFELLAPEAAA